MLFIVPASIIQVGNYSKEHNLWQILREPQRLRQPSEYRMSMLVLRTQEKYQQGIVQD